MTMIFQKVIFIFAIAISSPVIAVEPDEVLDNPSLEERARQISKQDAWFVRMKVLTKVVL